jgi:NitT/TauT family transport system permease protein
MRFRLRRRVLLPTIAMLVLLLLWEVSVRAFSIPVYLLPAPSEIWREMSEIPGRMAANTFATFTTVIIGFIVSIVFSFPIAILIAYSRWWSDAISPILVFTQSIPKVALAPILVVALGPNEVPRVVITFLVAFFPLVISLATGLMATPRELRELGRVHLASRWQELIYIRLPYAVPHIFSGLKVAVTLAVIGAVVGEFVAADKGLGYMITSASAYFRTPLAYGAMVILSLMGILLFQAIVVIEAVFFPWSADRQNEHMGDMQP